MHTFKPLRLQRYNNFLNYANKSKIFEEMNEKFAYVRKKQ